MSTMRSNAPRESPWATIPRMRGTKVFSSMTNPRAMEKRTIGGEWFGLVLEGLGNHEYVRYVHTVVGLVSRQSKKGCVSTAKGQPLPVNRTEV